MNLSRLLFALAALVLLGGPACKPKPKEITSLQRKQAAVLVSDAQFAMTLRDYTRAESGLAQATALCPDDGNYWVSLGTVRIKLGQRDGAKTAYKNALAAYEDAATHDAKDVQTVFQQITVLALLGRVDDARALMAKLPERFPGNRDARVFLEQKQFDTMLADPKFRDMSL